MPSGKRAKQLRREAASRGRTPPPVRSKGMRGPRQASPRALTIGGVVVAAVIVAIVLGVVLSRGGGSKVNISQYPKIGNAHSAVALQGAPQANALFQGIPQKGLVLGKPTAPVEMEIFIDVQCPVCQNYEINYLPTIVQKYIRTGQVQLHMLPWAFLGPQSFSGRLGLIAATLQNKGFEYAKVLYDNQQEENTGWLTDPEMLKIASSVNGLQIHQWSVTKNGSGVQSIAKDVNTLARKVGVAGTPTVLVGPYRGKLENVTAPHLAPTLPETEQAIKAALAETQ